MQAQKTFVSLKNLLRSFKYFLFGLAFCFCQTRSFSQNQIVDSLKTLLKNAKHDTTRLRLRVMIGEVDMILRLSYWDSIYIDSKKLKSRTLEAIALDFIGFVYRNQGNSSQALNYYNQSLKIEEETGNKKGIAESLNNIGFVYDNQGDIPKALNYYERSLKIQEEIGDKNGTAYSLLNIGFTYSAQHDILKALDHNYRALKLFTEIQDKEGMGHSFNNIASIYYHQANIPKALEYFKKGLKIREELGDNSDIANSLSNLGSIYNKQGDLSQALDYFLKSLYLRKEINEKQGIASSFDHIGAVYLKQKKYDLAHAYADSALVLSKELGFPENLIDAEITLSMIDSASGNYAGAYEHYKQFIIYNDSIANEGTRKASIKSQLKYEYEKKEAVIKEQQEKERIVAEEKDRFQKIVILSVIVGLVLVIVFAFFIFRSLKVTRHQKEIIEEKQKEILDSIYYAKRIQTSLLPTEKYLRKYLNRS